MTKYIIRNELTSNFSISENSDLCFISLNEVSSLKNSIIYGAGEDVFSYIKEKYDSGEIHLGIRTKRVSKTLLGALPFIQFSGNKLFVTFDTDDYAPKYNMFLQYTGEEYNYDLPECEQVSILDLTPERFFEILNYFDLLDCPLGIDFETAGDYRAFPTQAKFMPLGVSIADMKGKRKAYYFDFWYYDETRNDPKYSFFYDGLKTFFDNNYKRLWAYNCSFEIGCLYRMFGTFYEIQDSWAYCMIDGNRKGLKYNMQLYFGMGAWDEETSTYMNKLRDYLKCYGRFTSDSKFDKEASFKAFKNSSDFTSDSFNEFKELMISYEPNWLERLEKFWGSVWGCIPYKLMGYYCCLDSYMDLLLYEKISPIYNTPEKEKAYPTKLDNLYLKARSDLSTALKIDWELKKKIKSFYETLEFNLKLLCNKMLLQARLLYIEKTASKEMLSLQIPSGILYSIGKLNSYFFLEDSDEKLAKAFLSLIFTKGKISTTRVKNLIGEENYDEIYWAIGLLTSVEKNELTFIKTISLKDIQNTTKLFSGLKKINLRSLGKIIRSSMRVDETLKSIIDFYIKNNAKELASRNTKILSVMSKSKLEPLIRKGSFPAKTDVKVKNYVKKYFLNEPGVIYKSKPNFMPSDYIENILTYQVAQECIVKLNTILENRTLESPIDPSLNKHLILNIDSSKECAIYGKWLKELFSEELLCAMLFLEAYQKRCPNKFEKGLCLWQDYLDTRNDIVKNMSLLTNSKIYNILYTENIPWTLVNLSYVRAGTPITKYGPLNFMNCFSDVKPYELKLDSKLEDIKDVFSIGWLDFFDKCFRLYKFAGKEISSYFGMMEQNSYEILEISSGLAKCYSRYEFNKKQEDDGKKKTKKKIEVQDKGYYFPEMMIGTTKTGRFSSGIQTTSGDDDSKLTWIVDEPGYIFEYKDVSQAEPRTIAWFSRDEELIKLYKENGDIYRITALKVYPHLKDPRYAEDLEKIRGDYKVQLLRKLYMGSARGMAAQLGIPVKKVEEVYQSIDKAYPKVVSWSKELYNYCMKTGTKKSILGERMPLEKGENPMTVSVNHPVQSATSSMIAAGINNEIRSAHILGIEKSFKYSVHDASINLSRVDQLFHNFLISKHFFLNFIEEYYSPYFAYDLDIMYNNRDHMTFDFDLESGEFIIKGFKHHVDYVLKYLKDGYKFDILQYEVTPFNYPDKINNFFHAPAERGHMLFPLSKLSPNLQLVDMKGVLTEKLKNIEFLNGPTYLK